MTTLLRSYAQRASPRSPVDSCRFQAICLVTSAKGHSVGLDPRPVIIVVGGSSGRGFSSRSASSLVDLFQFIALIGHKPLCQPEVDIQRRCSSKLCSFGHQALLQVNDGVWGETWHEA